MVAAHEDCKIWCSPDTTVVFMEVANLAVFDWDRHAIQIISVADCLALLIFGFDPYSVAESVLVPESLRR